MSAQVSADTAGKEYDFLQSPRFLALQEAKVDGRVH
jgi:hypothetical protein